MLVFKTYFKLLNKYKGNIILYFAIFLGFSLFMTTILSSSGEESFQAERLDIAIVDRDGKTVGIAIENYFKENNDFAEVPDNKKKILDELYWRALDYVLVIPKGFEESLINGEEPMELECMKVPGNFESSYFESELNLYMSKLTGLLKAGYSLEEAQDMLMELSDEKTDVEIASFVNANQHDVCTSFFAYAPYLFISVGIVGIGIILLCFNKDEVKKRTECGALQMKERITGLSAGILVFGLILYLSVILVGAIISKGSILTDNRMPFFMLNMFAILIFSLSLGFFAGMTAKTSEAVNGMVNIFSLGLCFLGGVFVPREFFGAGVDKVAKFIPTYWYTVSNETIGAMKEVTSGFIDEIAAQTGVIFCYALVIFAVTLVIVSGRRKQTS